jgi:signal transduction histidine kinase
MNTRTKITASFVFFLVLFGGVFFSQYFRSERTNQQLTLLHELLLPLARHIAQLQTGVQGLADDVRRYYFGARPTAEASTFSRMVRDLYPYVVRKNFSEVETLVQKFSTEENQPAVSNLAIQLNLASKSFDTLSTTSTRESFEKALQDLKLQLEALASRVEEESQKISQAAKTEGRETLFIGLLLSGFLMSIGVLTLFLSRRSLRSLPLLVESLKQMGDGDFVPSLKVHAGDEKEIAELARQYNRMLTALGERDKKIQQQQRDLLQSERLAAVGQLSAEIVHEIRNPLNSINLNIDWLDVELKDANREVTRTLGSISREIERLHQITENYLVRARVPAKSSNRTPVHELLREIVDFGREEDRSRGIQVELDFCSEELYVQTERARLKQAFLNVLRNAKEAMPRGGKVTVKTGVHQNVFLVQVVDRGSGMNDATRRQTFQPFFTTKPDGTGLGLMVTKAIVEEAHGSIHCESNIGQGTTISFQFPA